MSNILPLLKINILQLLLSFGFKGSKNRTKSYSAIGLVALVAALMLYMGGVYAYGIAYNLLLYDAVFLVLPVLFTISILASFMFTVFTASSFLFGSKDVDLLFSLPISPSTVLLSKMFSMYLESEIFCFFMLLPAAFIYSYFTVFSLHFFIIYFIGVVFLPLIPCILTSLFGFIISALAAKTGKGGIFTTLFSILSLVLFFAFIYVNGSLITNIGGSVVQVWGFFKTYLVPIYWLTTAAINVDYISLLYFVASLTLVFALYVYVLSIFYKSIVTGLLSNSTRKNFKLGSYKSSSAVYALYKKEAKRYFTTTIYIFNTGFAPIAMIIVAVLSIVSKDTLNVVLSQMSEISPGVDFSYYILYMLLVLVSLSCTTNSSISLEGKTLWILKEAPLTVTEIFLAKILLNLTIVLPPLVISVALFSYSFNLSIINAISIMILCTLVAVSVAMQGLLVNLVFPKMDAVNDTQVVKQSISALVGILVPMVVIGGGGYLLSQFVLQLQFLLVVSAIFVVFAIACVLLYLVLTSYGKKLFLEL